MVYQLDATPCFDGDEGGFILSSFEWDNLLGFYNSSTDHL